MGLRGFKGFIGFQGLRLKAVWGGPGTSEFCSSSPAAPLVVSPQTETCLASEMEVAQISVPFAFAQVSHLRWHRRKGSELQAYKVSTSGTWLMGFQDVMFFF